MSRVCRWCGKRCWRWGNCGLRSWDIAIRRARIQSVISVAWKLALVAIAVVEVVRMARRG